MTGCGMKRQSIGRRNRAVQQSPLHDGLLRFARAGQGDAGICRKNWKRYTSELFTGCSLDHHGAAGGSCWRFPRCLILTSISMTAVWPKRGCRYQRRESRPISSRSGLCETKFTIDVVRFAWYPDYILARLKGVLPEAFGKAGARSGVPATGFAPPAPGLIRCLTAGLGPAARE